MEEREERRRDSWDCEGDPPSLMVIRAVTVCTYCVL